MDNLFALILDGVVLVLLIGTMIFAARLSIYLKSFRDSRQDLEKLLKDLSDQVDHAEYAIDNLKSHARNTGRDLQGAVDEAVHLKDELHIMNEYGDKLAVRLERLLDQRGESVPHIDAELPSSHSERKKEDKQSADIDDEPRNMFKIRDIDIDRGETDDLSLLDEEDEGDEKFSSEAERELYNALKKKTKAGGVS